ncbi:LacI family DNA-binding transcriptional regulator [Verminephrobacter eiseniae]|uniref:LacI family DNA-binding transcriptional regulator n=1 Tax=Verminephrobacter eiseniae TaxID=364317 RepID=UPI001E4A673F|nr:LacI family DNA-binding transcriptional regulator [Verminephrobacter eiseniae]
MRTPGNRHALHGWRCAARRCACALVFVDKPRLPITPRKPHLAKASTIRDIAALAKVSKATVSRYLNGTLDLPQETRRRIDDAVLALNYRQNSLARRLSIGSSEMIGLVMPDVANPFFAELADAVEQAAFEGGFGLALCITRNQLAREALYLGWLDTQHLDGLIFATNRPDDGSLGKLIGERSNIVLIDEDVPGVDIPKVFVDNIEGGYLATRHLLDAGHTRIAHVTGPAALFTVRERLAGYRRALDTAHIPFDASLVLFGSYERRFGQTAAAELVARDDAPTAIFAGSDYLAVGMLETLRDCGLDVPGDMSIVGFDDMEFASLLMPPITTLKQSAREMGSAGVAILLAMLADHSPAPATGAPVQRLPVRLIERASVAPPRKKPLSNAD